MYIPKAAFEQFMGIIEKEGENKKDCITTKSGFLFCSCWGVDDDGWPDIDIEMGSGADKYWFKLKSEDYLIYARSG